MLDAFFLTLARNSSLPTDTRLSPRAWMTQTDRGPNGTVTCSFQPDPQKYLFVHDEVWTNRPAAVRYLTWGGPMEAIP